MMPSRISPVGAIVASLVVVILLLLSGIAEATEATIDESHVCLDSGEWQIRYSVWNDDPRPLEVTDQDPAIWPSQLPPKALTFSDFVTLPGDALGHSATVIGVWSPTEPPAFLVGIVDLREEICSPVTTTTTTTEPTPESTTTTIPGEEPSTTTTTTVPVATTTTAPTASVGPPPVHDAPALTELPFTGLGDYLWPLLIGGIGFLALGFGMVYGTYRVGRR